MPIHPIRTDSGCLMKYESQDVPNGQGKQVAADLSIVLDPAVDAHRVSRYQPVILNKIAPID